MATTETAPAHEPAKSPWPQVIGVVALLTVVLSLMLAAFAWPAARSSVHGVPIAVAGPAAAADQVINTLTQRDPDAFEITRVADTAAAEKAIRDRAVYGAIDLTSGRPTLLIASAGSPAVAQALQGLAQAMSAQTSGVPPAPVRDLAPLPEDDPRGAGLAAGALPLVIGGLLTALLFSTRIRGVGRRIVGALAFAVTGGLAMTAILQFWLGSIEGDYWANSGVVALAIAATGTAILGLESLLGPAGFGLGAAVMMLLGNPLAGMASAPEMLPGWSGQLGQLLPPGAAGSLLRSTAFFDGHAATGHVVVLAAWLAAGLVLCALGGLRGRTKHGAHEAPVAAALEPVRAGI